MLSSFITSSIHTHTLSLLTDSVPSIHCHWHWYHPPWCNAHTRQIHTCMHAHLYMCLCMYVLCIHECTLTFIHSRTHTYIHYKCWPVILNTVYPLSSLWYIISFLHITACMYVCSRRQIDRYMCRINAHKRCIMNATTHTYIPMLVYTYQHTLHMGN